MNLKRISAFIIAFVMIFACFPLVNLTADAMAGAGAPTDMDYYVLGIDVSEWQGDAIDYAKLKASGCEYVIIRAGYAQNIDECFVTNYNNARAAGMPLGVYLYSHALTRAGAAAEAQFCIELFERYDMYFEYPIYMDVERDDQIALSWQDTVALCEGWCETLEAAGYFPGVYALLSIMTDLKKDDDFTDRYDLWVPNVGTVDADGNHFTHTSRPYNEDGYGMWQYSWFNLNNNGQYIYDGVYDYGTTKTENLDLDVCYKDYPSIMAKYGYNNCGTPALSTGKKYTTTTPDRADKWDDDGARLTDGRKGAIDGGSTGYSGWKSGPVDITVDLGTGASNHNTYTLYTASNSEWGISAPSALTVSVSNNGSDFTTVGKSFTAIKTASSSTTAWNTYTFTVQSDASNYRYVRFTVDTGATHIWIDEVTVDFDEKYNGGSVIPDASLTYQKSYTASGVYSDANGKIPYPDEDGKTMTDGIMAGAGTNYADTAFVGLHVGTDFYKANGYASILVDLGNTYWVDEFTAHHGTAYNESYGISAPATIEVYVSSDKSVWTKAGAMTVNNDTSLNCAKSSLTLTESVSARYIDYRFTGLKNWIMVAEVSAFEGAAATHTCTGTGNWISDENNHWKTCTCGAKCDEAAHDDGAWSAIEGGEVLKCTVCGYILDQREDKDEEEPYIVGDVDGDGSVQSADYLLVKRYCFCTYQLNDEQLKRADANADGYVNSLDYSLIKRFAFA